MAGKKSNPAGGILWNVVLSLVLTTFIITAAVVFTLNFKWLYYVDITLLHLEQRSGMSVEAIRATYDALIRYNQFWYTGELTLPTLPMSPTGRIHFQEVKQIFSVIQILCLGCFAGSVFGIVRQWRRRQKGYLWMTGILTLALPLVLGAFALFNWDGLFVAFHHLFFRNDYWLFDSATDPVILILPDTFFLHCAVLILVCIFLGGFLCLYFARKGSRKKSSQKRRR